MKAKPKGPKYRNLFSRAGVIYYERAARGRRVKISTKTSSWEDAAAFRDLYEQAKGIGRVPFLQGEVPTFADLAARYLKEGAAHLAGSTREDRGKMLGEAGRLTRYFGPRKVDEITRPLLMEWWHLEVEARGRHERTGLTYLSALSSVLGFGVDLELLAENPIDALRAILRRHRRSKRGRAAANVGHVHPIEAGADLARFIEASEALGGRRFASTSAPVLQHRHGHVADLLMLDAGLRTGEVAGLRWRDVEWGDGPADTRRALLLREAKARGKHAEAPKSGRARRVALSLRLRRALRDLWVASGQPASEEHVLPRFQPHNYQLRHFDAVCARAGLTGYTPKDLRDTFASQLLTAGVQLGYVSQQLGHSDVSVTARHYARWAGGDAYRRSLEPSEGEVPADLVSRGAADSHQTPTTAAFEAVE